MSLPIKKLLEKVRPFTGGAFSAASGYDARKKLNFGRQMALLKYARKVDELTSSDYVLYAPKRGEKTEAFSYTGQKGYAKFQKAIIPKIDPEAKLTFTIDKRRPKGGRFIVTDKTTQRSYMHLDGLTMVRALEDPENDGIDAQDIIYDLLNEYMGDARYFLIQAGNGYMWGASGQMENIVSKILGIMTNYGGNLFAMNSSSHWQQWFRGVTGFTDRRTIAPMIGQKLKAKREYLERARRIMPMLPDDGSKFRRLSGTNYRETNSHYYIARFLNGEMIPGTIVKVEKDTPNHLKARKRSKKK